KIHGPIYNRRTDIIGFINGIPLVFIELKKPTVDIYNAYIDNLRDYVKSIPQLFYYNAFLLLGNGPEAKVGTLESKFAFFHEWKRLAETDAGKVALKTALLGLCKKENLLDIIENFIVFDESGGKLAKILARNHQYLGVNKAVEKYARHEFKDGKLGVFWHTQGSGKSYSMLFFVRKIQRKLSGNRTFLVLTDRVELDKQLRGTFASCGMLGTGDPKRYVAESGTDLINKIKDKLPIVFSLIHKFNKADVEPYYPDHEVIIISDEAHRSQNGIYAENLCRFLPTASRIGFTGTPIFSSNEITARTFGDYISTYDFKRAVDDNATVPLYYENRGEKLKEIENPAITDEMLDAIERADLDENQREKLMQQFKKEIHLLMAEPRLKTIAKDFVEHYSNIWQSGKAMFVCLNKITCVRMYNYVQQYWQEKIVALEQEIKVCTSDQEAMELEQKLRWMKETDMAVVVSEEQNEQEEFAKWGLDITPHRLRMKNSSPDEEFKQADNPFRIVFVCAMWLTGFDCPSLSCLYLDKMMKDHTLMQAIARANRVAEGKCNGLIVDYVGIVQVLKKALANYTRSAGEPGEGNDPTEDKDKLIAKIVATVNEVKDLLKQQGCDLKKLRTAQGFDKEEILEDIEDALCASLEIKKNFQVRASDIQRMLKLVDRKEIPNDTYDDWVDIREIAKRLQAQRRHADTTDLMVEINKIISSNVKVDAPKPGDIAAYKKFDISKIDFGLLRAEFAREKHKHTKLRDLEEVVQQVLNSMLANNPTRVDYQKRYNEIIAEYNTDQDKVEIEKVFIDLINLSNELSQEQQRYVRENLDNEEQLAIYDMLYSDKLSKDEIKAIKDMSKELYAKIHELMEEMNNWAQKENTKAKVKEKIYNIIYYSAPDVIYDHFQEYQDSIFEYYYTRYGAAA
ncbi:MAG: type I restriction endonuclease subunit R, partial [Phascolarctobacterium sp.]